MKVTIYTTSTCPFSKLEKEYLQSKNIVFEEKNVEENRDFLSELLVVSNNFAGTPVTKIEKDDGQAVVLNGFTREEFDAVLGPTVMVAQQQPAEPTTPAPQPPTTEPPTTETPPPPPPMPEPVPEPTPPPVVPEVQPEPPTPPVVPEPQPEPAAPPIVEPPKPEPVKQAEPNDALDAILKDLQNKVNEAYSTQGQDQPSPKPVDQPEQPEDKPPQTPPPPVPQPPQPQPATPPAPSAPPVVPDFPK